MKLIRKILVICIELFLLVSCTPNTTETNVTDVNSNIIWISVSMSENSYLFKIGKNDTIQVISGNVIFDTGTKEIFCGENIKKRNITPNFDKMVYIKDLLLKIGEKEEDVLYPGNDTTEVFAFINNKIYWTPFYGGQNNSELSELTDILLQLSSVKIEK